MLSNTHMNPHEKEQVRTGAREIEQGKKETSLTGGERTPQLIACSGAKKPVEAIAQTKPSIPTDPRFINLTRRKFGRWTVLGYNGKIKTDHYWLCLCECGKDKSVAGVSLQRGASQSCGCMAFELSKTRIKHGDARCSGTSKAYRCWCHVKERTSNPKCKNWHNYGGRGITMFPAWMESFQEFYSYVGTPPTAGHSIDRFPDMNGNYEPGNVRWATAKEQAQNRRGLVLSEEVAAKIRQLKSDGWKMVKISRYLGVTYASVKHVIHNGTWN